MNMQSPYRTDWSPQPAVRPKDVLNLGRTHPIIHTVLTAWENGSFRSWEEAMMHCVVYLANANADLESRVIVQLQNEKHCCPVGESQDPCPNASSSSPPG